MDKIYIVKPFSKSGLHITLSTKEFKAGDKVRLFHETDFDKQVRKIVQEEIDNARQY